MNSNQFNELLSNMMLIALNTAGIFQQNQRMRALTIEEIGHLQTDVLRQTHMLKDYLTDRNPLHEQAPILDGLSFGRADT